MLRRSYLQRLLIALALGVAISVSAQSTVYFGGPGAALNESGPATPYPLTISVSGVAGTIGDLNVQLLGLSHTWPADLDIVLVGPDGHAVMLMSDAGTNQPISSVDLLFDDAAAAISPSQGLTTSSLHPGNFAPLNDTFPAPYPGTAFGTDLAVFNGTSANGDWRLFINDDSPLDSGAMNSWVLQFQMDVVPEPSTWIFGVVGFGAFFARRFFRR